MAHGLKNRFPAANAVALSALLTLAAPFNAWAGQEPANNSAAKPATPVATAPAVTTAKVSAKPVSYDGITVIDRKTSPDKTYLSEAQDTSLYPNTIGFALSSNDAQEAIALNRAKQIQAHLKKTEGIDVVIFYELNNRLPGAGGVYYINGASVHGTPYDTQGSFNVNGIVQVVLDGTLVKRFKEIQASRSLVDARKGQPDISSGTLVVANNLE